MAYTTLPDRRIPYDDDGSVVGFGTSTAGILYYPTGSEVIDLNDYDFDYPLGPVYNSSIAVAWFWFPEQREVTAYYANDAQHQVTGAEITGSNDTTNGLDGTWETASLGSGASTYTNDYSWRSNIKPVSFTGGKTVVRLHQSLANTYWCIAHWYGQKVAGRTADDILFLDGLASYAEFTAPEDFGDVPLGTSSVRTFKVKNASATHTANTINLQCNDADFAISTDNSTWVTTINISSLAAGASSATLYVRNTTPAAGNLLGPRFARIVATVGSWT